MSKVYSYCILGFGIAGQILALELRKQGILEKDILILDETFLGGDLSLIYSSVLSNTPWWKTKQALLEYSPWSDIWCQAIEYEDSNCTPVSYITKACLDTALQAISKADMYSTHIQSIEYKDTKWVLSSIKNTFYTETLFLTIGGQPKYIDIPKPTIPLSIALDLNKLQPFLKKAESISVFGTSHSGILAIQSILKVNSTIPIYAIYKGVSPFVFESEGHYSGLKEDSAQFAKEIQEGKYPTVTCISWSDPLEIHNALLKSSACILAIGFEAKTPFGHQFKSYSHTTAKLDAGPRLYGFGMAYPGKTEFNGKEYEDSSVLSFQSQIKRCLPAILSTN